MTDNHFDESCNPLDEEHLQRIVEAALFAANRPLSVDDLLALFGDPQATQPLPERKAVRAALKALREIYATRGVQLVEVASGFRFQANPVLTPWLKRLWQKRAPRYSRALLETLAVIAYRQPITRGEIEKIRGVSVSTAIMKSLQDYQWIRVLGHRETPGKPALFGTTRAFLDHFSLKSLDDLPTLAQLKTMANLQETVPEPTAAPPALDSELEFAAPEELEVDMVEADAESLHELAALSLPDVPTEASLEGSEHLQVSSEPPETDT